MSLDVNLFAVLGSHLLTNEQVVFLFLLIFCLLF